jgi:cytochrome c oxidase accessory protein FixG
MFDKNTLIVAYDVERGEPRSGRSRKIDFNSTSGLGDCIDCTLCVQVCPVGIDIRNGLQYECISCGLCIDACNNVMDMMQYPRDLIRFSTQNGVSQQWSKSQIIKNIFRPRVLFYVFLLLIATGSLVFSVLNREPFKVDVIRDRGVMARVTDQGSLENIYQLLITNVSGKDDTYHVQVSGIEDVSVVSNDIFKVNAASENKVVLSVRVPSENVNAGVYPIKFKVVANNSKRRIFERSVFYVPAE